MWVPEGGQETVGLGAAPPWGLEISATFWLVAQKWCSWGASMGNLKPREVRAFLVIFHWCALRATPQVENHIWKILWGICVYTFWVRGLSFEGHSFSFPLLLSWRGKEVEVVVMSLPCRETKLLQLSLLVTCSPIWIQGKLLPDKRFCMQLDLHNVQLLVAAFVLYNTGHQTYLLWRCTQFYFAVAQHK